MQAYEKLLPADAFPSYFIFLDVDPAAIDINVHPTKTEIKFENENAVWQIINAATRESLGKNNIVPSIDFDQEGSVDIPLPPRPGTPVNFPAYPMDPGYNPFNEDRPYDADASRVARHEQSNLRNWGSMYSGMEQGRERFDKGEPEGRQTFVFPESTPVFTGNRIMQLKQKYLILPVKSGLMVIDQRRARERILYERFLDLLKTEQVASQQILFPVSFEVSPADTGLLTEILPDLQALGFDIREFGKATFIINGVPGILETPSPVEIVEKLLEEFKNSPVDARGRVREQVAISLSRASAMNYGEELQPGQMDQMVDQLFACTSPNYTPDGKTVVTIIPLEEVEKLFGR